MAVQRRRRRKDGGERARLFTCDIPRAFNVATFFLSIFDIRHSLLHATCVQLTLQLVEKPKSCIAVFEAFKYDVPDF